ncbi:hypothetical protein DICPUDRAFT_82111 [Dictyostelium purpureum]|uniref:Uncharacterized protein n=1 Tax=Dictyostelium purpureum TaxID=5786 RepID=F0ZVJ6_DICPU|nr:uncharacterized protein DICPUDRAFT_82111 [Dictyostelium purpureum]EGC32022.1 hypothetical protein DICPUDRAFT_82111 [Dictyostelium purpureum]|eukprot:XP_003291440.1 hypothetical protein DICPUDRAFT_82111 [Dictyostelium purpureum]
MEKLQISGYYINIDGSDYNTFGKVEGKWIKNCQFYIDISKQVILKSNGSQEKLIEAERSSKDIDVYSGPVGDSLYEPISMRVGDLKNKINFVVFSGFGIGKGSKDTVTSLNKFPNDYGILLPGGIKISLYSSPQNTSVQIISNQDDDVQSQLFYQNFRDIKFHLNQHKCLSAASVFESVPFCDLPGFDHHAFHIMDQDPLKFIENYCSPSNDDYKQFKQFILKMHSLFNLLIWDIEDQLNQYPGLILILGRAYKEINEQHKQYQGDSLRLEYQLSFPCDLFGLNTLFVHTWEKKYLDHFKDDTKYQRPCSVGFLTSSLNPNEFNESKSNIFEAIVDAPFGDHPYGVNSINVLKSLFGTNDINQVKSKSFIVPTINSFEPINAQYANVENCITFVNEEFISKLTDMVISKGLMGICLYKDRSEFKKDNKPLDLKSNNDNKLIPPATIKYDDSISKLYTHENQLKTENFINYLDHLKK